MATATQIKDLQTRLDKLFKPAGTVKATNDTWSRNKLALDTMESANKIPVLNQSGSTKGKSKASAAALKAYPNMPESYKEMLSDLAGREGYNPNFYLDGSGYLTTGVGLTGKYVADETPFRSMTDHENKAKRLVPGLEYYTPEIQKSIIHAAYRGDLTYPEDDKYGNKAGDPYKWINNLNSGKWNEAADELLRNNEYYASRGKDSKGNSVDIKNPGLQSYFEDIHNTLKEQHYIENPSDRPEDSGFMSDIVDDGLAFGNKVLRKVDRTIDSTVDSVEGFMDELLSTGEMPQQKVPSIKTQEIPVPEQGTTVPKAENEMATPEAQAYFKDFRNLNDLPNMTDNLVPHQQQLVEDKVIPVDSYSPGVEMQVKPKPMYPLAGTVTKEPLDTGPAQFAEIETLLNEPRTYVPESGRMNAYSYVDNTLPQHAEEFSQAFSAPFGREPAGIPTQPQNNILMDQFGRPVTSGNGNAIGLPTQKPAYKAPAGGKGANATPQSAIDQLTGVKGFGGK